MRGRLTAAWWNAFHRAEPHSFYTAANTSRRESSKGKGGGTSLLSIRGCRLKGRPLGGGWRLMTVQASHVVVRGLLQEALNEQGDAAIDL